MVLGSIQLKDVCFTFPSRPNVTILKNVNLNIESNTVTAIVGRSGSGKSTIASLLLRFYDPESGGVYVDGVDIKQLNLNWLRNHIGAVSQEPILFSGTILSKYLAILHTFLIYICVLMRFFCDYTFRYYS